MQEAISKNKITGEADIDEVMQNASHTISLIEDYLREISSQRTQNGVILELPPLEASEPAAEPASCHRR